MLRILAKRNVGMLFHGSHVADAKTVRRLACDGSAEHTLRCERRSYDEASRNRIGGIPLELLMLVPIWIAAPLMVLATIADLVRST